MENTEAHYFVLRKTITSYFSSASWFFVVFLFNNPLKGFLKVWGGVSQGAQGVGNFVSKPLGQVQLVSGIRSRSQVLFFFRLACAPMEVIVTNVSKLVYNLRRGRIQPTCFFGAIIH